MRFKWVTLMNNISIIIPVLNEEANIGRLLAHLKQNSSNSNVKEIIVVDGNSTDGTCNTVFYMQTIYSDIRLLHSEKGRARQMNFGEKHAKGNILYFLHADSFPPKHFDELIIDEVKKGNNAGCFKMKFDHNHWWLFLASWLTQFSWRACRGGDQSQFITKQLFNEIGGFDERFLIYEDNDLINKLYARRQFVVIQKWLTTSARRYKKFGIWKLQYYFWSIYIKKWFGASSEELHRYYQKNVAS